MGYVELHCHSAYSFGDGASDPAELAAAAAERGYEALALTDHDNVCGAMEFAHACRGVGIRPIVGCELTVDVHSPASRATGPVIRGGSADEAEEPPDRWGSPILRARMRPRMGPPAAPPVAGAEQVHVTLLVESATGWSNLCRLITEGHAGTRPKEGREPLPPSVPFEALERHADGLV